ncbi:MAG TPA: methyltransferase domain-containing protein [Methanoculleus sp.]|nr:methyltransferase domain-containing protein [Methanoculleus sp.]
MKRLDVCLEDVQEAYTGPVGVLWELLMGEEIHVGGWEDTERLAALAGVTGDADVLDVCSALGGPARHLAGRFGCRVTGLDATPKMVEEAQRRTARAGFSDRVRFRLGDALAMPFADASFDIVWGQDAWCYVTDKAQLIGEACRVLRPGGTIAFTDWVETGAMDDACWETLHRFMLFPYTETLDGYTMMLEDEGFAVVRFEDISSTFPSFCREYRRALTTTLREQICDRFGEDLLIAAEQGITGWIDAAERGLVGRGRWIGWKADE